MFKGKMLKYKTTHCWNSIRKLGALNGSTQCSLTEHKIKWDLNRCLSLSFFAALYILACFNWSLCILRAQMERMRHEAEESERIRKELQEKLRLMQEEQERTSRGENCTWICIGVHVSTTKKFDLGVYAGVFSVGGFKCGLYSLGVCLWVRSHRLTLINYHYTARCY